MMQILQIFLEKFNQIQASKIHNTFTYTQKIYHLVGWMNSCLWEACFMFFHANISQLQKRRSICMKDYFWIVIVSKKRKFSRNLVFKFRSIPSQGCVVTLSSRLVVEKTVFCLYFVKRKAARKMFRAVAIWVSKIHERNTWFYGYIVCRVTANNRKTYSVLLFPPFLVLWSFG